MTGRVSSREAKTEIKVGYSAVIVLFVCGAPSDGWTHPCPETTLTINPHDNPPTQTKEIELDATHKVVVGPKKCHIFEVDKG